jgi:uncharacterized protein (TIGR03435 family)
MAALITVTPRAVPGQQGSGLTKVATLPEFEAATIKPIDPKAGGAVGFYGRSGGRVFLGYATVKMLVYYAFNVQYFQIVGGPDWVSSEKYEIEAVPPDASPSRTIRTASFNAEPTQEQRQMLQSLLATRLAFKYHKTISEGPVYILTRGKGKLQLHEPKDKEADPRAIVRFKPGNVIDGSAIGTNTSTAYIATMLSGYLQQPVLDQTGIQGTFDYELPPDDPTNQDVTVAVVSVMQRLGLKLEKGKGPVETVMIDYVEHPSPN